MVTSCIVIFKIPASSLRSLVLVPKRTKASDKDKQAYRLQHCHTITNYRNLVHMLIFGNFEVDLLSLSSISTVVLWGEPSITLFPIGARSAKSDSVASTILSSVISMVISALFESGANTTVLVTGAVKSASSAVCWLNSTLHKNNLGIELSNRKVSLSLSLSLHIYIQFCYLHW